MRIFDSIRETYAARYQPETQKKIAGGYWVFLISGCVCVSIMSVAYGAWQFSRPLDEGRSGATVRTPQKALNRGDLQEVLNGWDARVQSFEERQKSPTLADPS